MTTAELRERIAAASEAKEALDRFLAPAFAAVIAGYTARLQELAADTPWDAAKIVKLAQAVKIAREVQVHIASAAHDGPLAEAELKRAQKIERMSTERRKILGL